MPKANHLKLMVDYDLKDPEILEKLEGLGALDVKTTIQCGYFQHTTDPVLIWEGTTKENRILLTANYGDIGENRYAPCKHGGIIIIDHPRPSPDIVFAYVKALLQCGKRKFVKNHVTHLKRDGIKIVTHEKEPVTILFDEKPNLRKIVKGI
jgi:hypothetical protein